MTEDKQFPMTWEQAVDWLRRQPDQEEMVKACFFDDPLLEAAKRFSQSEEWKETRKRLPPPPGKALDLGAGRGISSYAMAVDGYEVTALEPDPSPLVGAGAIKSLAEESRMPIVVVQEWGESLPFAENSFDLVHARQVLHHAHSLPDLCKEVKRVLKPDGIFIATREHIVDRPEELPSFFENHPMHHLFGGENAFSLPQYIGAIDGAGFYFREVLTHFDNIINIFPLLEEEVTEELQTMWRWPWKPSDKELSENARRVFRNPGRLYTFVTYVPNPAIPEEIAEKLKHSLVVQEALNNVSQAELNSLRQEHDALRQEHDALRQEHDALRQEHDALRQYFNSLREEFDYLRWSILHPFRWFFGKIREKLRRSDTQG